MAVSFADALALLRIKVQRSADTHAALGGITLNAALSGRVLGARLLDADAQTVERPSLIIEEFSGVAEYSDALQIITVYVYAYSDDGQGHATDLYEAFHQVCQGTRLNDDSGNIVSAGYARELSRPLAGANEKMKSWFCRGVWQLRLA